MPVSDTTAEIVICGAGIAGIAAAYFLATQHNLTDILLVEQGDPLSLTSDKSTECYRNWWPGPGDAMVALMNRSIDLLEQIARATDNRIQMNRRGYLYATATPANVTVLRQTAEEAAALGAGALRIHGSRSIHEGHQGHEDRTAPDPPPASNTSPEAMYAAWQQMPYLPALAHGFEGQPDGADLILDPALIREHFPYLTERTIAVMHVRRAGWFSAQQLGMYMLEQAREQGVRLLRGEVVEVNTRDGQVRAVRIAAAGGTTTIATPRFVAAAGPLLPAVGRQLGVELPLFAERHIKATFNDHLGVVPRDAPLLIWADEVMLPWSDEERAMLAEDEQTRWLLGALPAGVHGRPEGQDSSARLLILWNQHLDPIEPAFPVPFEEHEFELALRGMAVMIPGLAQYIDRAPKPYVDGGYYTKTRENRPLIGPLPVEGAYIIGALSGYGVMAACAAGELVSCHVAGAALPGYAPAFLLARYDDAGYRKLLERWKSIGQL
jgi:glycine/D-amino acid oxidase-like deaminating enzyme